MSIDEFFKLHKVREIADGKQLVERAMACFRPVDMIEESLEYAFRYVKQICFQNFWNKIIEIIKFKHFLHQKFSFLHQFFVFAKFTAFFTLKFYFFYINFYTKF